MKLPFEACNPYTHTWTYERFMVARDIESIPLLWREGHPGYPGLIGNNVGELEKMGHKGV